MAAAEAGKERGPVVARQGQTNVVSTSATLVESQRRPSKKKAAEAWSTVRIASGDGQCCRVPLAVSVPRDGTCRALACRMPRFTRRTIAVLALLSTLITVGCARQEGDVSTRPEATGADVQSDEAARREATQADVQAVSDALDAAAAAGTLQYVVRQDVTSPATEAQGQSLTRAGKLDYGRRLHELTVTGQGLPETKIFFSGDRVFVQRAGGPYEEATDADSTPLAGVTSGDVFQLPAAQLLRTAELPGTALGGLGAEGGTRLNVTVAELEALSLLGAGFVSRLITAVGEENLEGEFDGRLPAEIALDGQGRLQGATIELDPLVAHIGRVLSEPELAELQFSYELSLSGLGEPLGLTPPDPA